MRHTEPTTYYSTRRMPVAVLDRCKVQALLRKVPQYWVVAEALRVGVTVMEKQLREEKRRARE